MRYGHRILDTRISVQPPRFPSSTSRLLHKRPCACTLLFLSRFLALFLKVDAPLMAISYRVEYVYLRSIEFLPRMFSSNADLQTVVSTSTFAASMSTTNFSEPWEFKPERWIGENRTDDLDASQPFSYGTRSCMGRRYDPSFCSFLIEY